MKNKKNTRYSKSKESNLIISRQFTVVELVVALSVFSIVMLVMLNFFSVAQNVWLETSQQSMTYENAKIAMELITRDLETAMYENGTTPFANFSSSDQIAFIATTPMKQNDSGGYTFEVQYRLSSDGWLERSVVGDTSEVKNASNEVISTSPNTAYNWSDWPTDNTIFADPTWKQVIPYVTELSFEIFEKNGISFKLVDKSGSNKSDTDFTDFPLIVKISFSLIDKRTMIKTEEMAGVWSASEIQELKEKNTRKFTKIVFLNKEI